MHHARREFLGKSGLALAASLGFVVPSGSVSNETIIITDQPVNIKKIGAVADGKTKNTALINQTIKTLSESGGGSIYFPAGRYLTGAIHLASNINLHLEPGAILQFSEDFDDYLPMVASRWQGVESTNFSPLIYAACAENISITGQGTIDGAGAVWWDYILKKRKIYKETGSAPDSKWQQLFRQQNGNAESLQSFGFLRPSLFQAYQCKNVLLSGVAFRNSPFWTTHYVSCENVVVDGIDIHNPDSPNTDGINPESSKNVRISNCQIDVDDDCITIKSGKGEWGRKNALPCENITITNCLMTGGASGVGIGSEMSGGVKKVVVSNCIFDGTSTGIHIKTNRERGGVVEDIRMTNLIMNNIQKSPAIHINTRYWIDSQPEPVNEKTPVFRNIHISDISGTNNKRAVEISGLEEMPVQNISVSRVNLKSEQGLVCEFAEDVQMSDITIDGCEESPYRIRECKNIALANLQSNSQANPKITFQIVKQAMVTRSFPFATGSVLELDGKENRQILLDEFLRKNQAAVSFINGASSSVLES